MIRAALALALTLAATAASALDPERREVTVISGRLWDGDQYREMFLPSTAPVLTILAGRDSAISFQRTQEYYWPLSRQVYADFESQRDPVPGTLRIERSGTLVAEVAEAPFAIHYPEGALQGNGSLLWGPDALQGFAAFEVEGQDFNRRFVAAQQMHHAYERALLDAARQHNTAALPAPPPLPAPSLRLVTKPLPGFRLALEPGEYRLSLHRDGQEVPGTARTLRVIRAEGRSALVADIVPEERWTRPLAANSPAARIYARAGSTFYLTLAEATLFDEADWFALISPQVLATPGRETWVRRRPAELPAVQVTANAAPVTLSDAALKVEQTSATAFGYIVRAARAGETPDLRAFPVSVPNDGPARLTVAVPERGFLREVVVVRPRAALAGFLLALVPAALALGIALARRLRRGRGVA